MDDLRYGLEIREEWCQRIRAGEKRIELRAYPLPSQMLHQQMAIICTNGPEGVSILGDVVEAGTSGAMVVGRIQFGRVKLYDSEASVEDDRSLHHVEKGSPYGWKEGSTVLLHGWVIEKSEWFDEPKGVPHMSRLLRSIFEIRH